MTKVYTEGLKLLKGVPLQTAVQLYTKSQGTSLNPVLAEALVQKPIKTRTEDGASERYIADLRSRPGRFGKAFQKSISNISTQDLDAWLRELTGGRSGITDRLSRRCKIHRRLL
jgi:hypothetical protein